MKRVFIDSDIFIRDLRYPRDQKTKTNEKFLKQVRSGKTKAYTSIFNVLEICGILSFNLSQNELLKLYQEFCEHYGVKILFPAHSDGCLIYDLPIVMEQIAKKQSLGDAQISYVIDRFTTHISSFISWNAKHFENKLPIPCHTPEQYLIHN